MRVLIDECLPTQLKGLLSAAHEVTTVIDVGWAGLKNGVLLREANARFDVLVTADHQMYYQQSFAGLRISIIVLPTNRLRLVKDAVPALLQSLGRVAVGQHVLMDLGADAWKWPELRLYNITDVDESGVTRHIFKPVSL
ncbi:MAG: DUF5615 family PIN-like protein [Vulcanimicrobiaceae bacterium]